MLSDEFAIIEQIKKALPRPSSRVFVGIGDDAAVVKSPRGKLVATVDTLVEGVHFDLSYTTPSELGHKALAVSLSDIAAMGAKPLYALVSLGLRQEQEMPFVTALYSGLSSLAKRHQVEVIGGNLVQSPTQVIVDICVIGEATKNYFTRSGAKVGDKLCVTGALGASTAGLQMIKRLGRRSLEVADLNVLLKAHVQPEPRVKESLSLLKKGGVTAMIDISDGLAKEIHHIAECSEVGVVLDEKAIPILPATLRAAELLGSDASAWALCGGEDYELLYTLSKSKNPKGHQVIGEIVARKLGIKIRRSNAELIPLEPKGWNHFVRRAKLKHTEAF